MDDCIRNIFTVYIFRMLSSGMFQVTLSIELNDSQLNEFERIIPVQLAQPPWNYTLALSKGITVRAVTHIAVTDNTL